LSAENSFDLKIFIESLKIPVILSLEPDEMRELRILRETDEVRGVHCLCKK